MERQRQKEEEEMMKAHNNRARKEQLKSTIENNKKALNDKVKREVGYFKDEKQEQKNMMHL